MTQFLDCLCDNKLSALIIEGDPPEEALKESWLVIMGEVHEFKEDRTTSPFLKLLIDIQRLRSHLSLVDMCIQVLKDGYNEEIAANIRKLGYPFPREKKLPSEYLTDLELVSDRAKTKFVQLNQALKLLGAEAEKVKDVKPDRDQFERNLIEYESMQKVTYNMDQITVYRYLQLEKKHTQMVELLKAKAEKNGR